MVDADACAGIGVLRVLRAVSVFLKNMCDRYVSRHADSLVRPVPSFLGRVGGGQSDATQRTLSGSTDTREWVAHRCSTNGP